MRERRGYMLLFLLGFVTSCSGGAVPKATRVGIIRTSIRATHRASPCRDGAVENAGKCYTLYTDAATFESASATCRAAPGGGHLITIDSTEIQDFVKAQMDEKDVDNLWLGARKEKTDWHWTKSDGNLKYQGCFEDNNDAILDVIIGTSANYTPDSCIAECRSKNLKYAGVKQNTNGVVCRCGNSHIADKYVTKSGCKYACPSDSTQKCGNIDVIRIYSVESVGVNGWLSTQPNNYENNQGCLAMHKGHYKWADETCSGGNELNMYGYVCQYDSDESSCSHKYAAGKCYSAHKVSSSPGVSWYAARYLCKEGGGELLQVDTKEIADFLYHNGTTQLDQTVDRWWLGGARERWQWMDGEDMIFTKWAGAMPNDAMKTCAVMSVDVGHGYEWEDKDCTEHAAFICLQQEPTTTAAAITAAATTVHATTDAPSTTTEAATTMESKMDTTPTLVKTTAAAASKPTTTTVKSTLTPSTTTTTKATPTTTAASTTTTKPTTTSSTTTTTTTTKPPTTKRTTTMKSTTTTVKSTTAKKTPGPLPPTGLPGGTMASTTSANSASAQRTTSKSNIFSTGVIVGIVLAVVFVLLAFLRLLIYCVAHDDSEKKKMPFDHDNGAKSETLSSFHDPIYQQKYDDTDEPAPRTSYDNPTNY